MDSQDNHTLFLRRADELDESILLKWVNEKTSRLNSFSSKEISPETHKKWFHEILHSDDKELFIMMSGNIAVGQIRLEISGNRGTISYSICEKYRGLGYGKIILQLLENWIAINYNIGFFLIGLVKKGNEISKHIFEAENYEKTESNEYIKYIKQIIPNKTND